MIIRENRLTLLLLFFFTVTAMAWIPEETIFEKSGHMSFRPDPATLCIITSRGDTVRFMNSEDIDFAEDYVRYTLVDRLHDIDYWVIHRWGYEWAEYILVSGRTGDVTRTISAPLQSPDGTRLLCVMDDIMAGFVDNGIQVWRIGPDGTVLEFEDLTMPWGPVDAMWENDSAVTFGMMHYDREAGEYIYSPGSMELSPDTTWMLRRREEGPD